MKITKHHKILNIITEIRNSHSVMVDVFSKGSCINLFMILRSIYPESIPYHNIDHVITKIDSNFYDINGAVIDTRGYMKLNDFSNRKKRIRKAFKEMYNGELKLRTNE